MEEINDVTPVRDNGRRRDTECFANTEGEEWRAQAIALEAYVSMRVFGDGRYSRGRVGVWTGLCPAAPLRC